MGFIPSKTWLACRLRCLNNRQSTKTCKPKNSWLVGKVKCGNCGYALTIRKAKTKWGRYFVCSQSGNICKSAGCTIYADVLEDYMFKAIQTKLSEFKELSAVAEENVSQRSTEKKIRLTQIDEEINELLSKVAGANNVLMKYINDRIAELDAARQSLQEELLAETVTNTTGKVKQITNHVGKWDSLSFEDKQAVVDTLIKVIRIANGNIEITWRI